MCTLEELRTQMVDMEERLNAKLDRYHDDSEAERGRIAQRVERVETGLYTVQRTYIPKHDIQETVNTSVNTAVTTAVETEIPKAVGPAVQKWFEQEWKPYGRLIKGIAVMIPTLASILTIMTLLGWL